MERKVFGFAAVKDEAEGRVLARFATLNAVDSDGDIIEPGAFGKQRAPVSAYGHTSWQGALPVGVGETREQGDEALADLEFFMGTTHGRDAFETIKSLGELGEWSFGFSIERERPPTEEERELGARRILQELDVHEVSPVLRGAGVGTQTLSAKCDGCGVPVPTVSPDEIRRAREQLDAASKRLRSSKGLGYRPRSFEVERLARFAAKVAHQLAGYPGAFDPPELRWFVPDADRPRSGFIRPGEHVTHVDLHLRGEQLVETIAHEAKHHAQVAARTVRRRDAEAEADAFGREWAPAILAAYRVADGDPYRVTVRRRRPPFPPEDRGSVVLARGKAWTHNPRNKGSSWTWRI